MGFSRGAWLASLALVALAGCERTRGPELLTLTEVVPTGVQIGDRVEVLGSDLPVGEVDGAEVHFVGELHRPGRAPIASRAIVVGHAELRRDRVSFVLDDGLSERFVGLGDEASHTTFRGRVEVRVPSAGVEVYGSVPGEVVLDVVPRAPRQAVAALREEETHAALGYLGLEVEQTRAGVGGVVVRRVAPSGRAAQAGVREGDAIESFGGLRVLEPADLIPPVGTRSAALFLDRAGSRVVAPLEIVGYRRDASRDLLPAAVLLGAMALVLLALRGPTGAALTWLTHRLSIGLSRTAPEGATGGRIMGLLRGITRDAHTRRASAAQSFGPYLAALGISGTFALIPFLELRRRAELDIGVLYLISVTSLSMMGLLTGGWRRGSVISRGLRAFGDVLVCEIPAAAAVIAVVLRTGSLRLHDVVAAQVGPAGGTLETGSWPWYWNAVQSPQLFVAFALFFVAVLVEPGHGAHDAAGSSTRRTAYFFAEWTNVFVMCSLGTALFLGGYHLPGITAHEHVGNGWLQLAGSALFLAKAWAVALVVLALRASLPRVRVDLLIRLGARWILPICVACLGLAWLESRFPLLPTAKVALAGITLAGFLVLTSSMLAAVQRAIAEPRLRARVNPFL